MATLTKQSFGNRIVLMQSEENGFGLLVFRGETDYVLRTYTYDQNHDYSSGKERETSEGIELVIDKSLLPDVASFFAGELNYEYRKCLENRPLRTS